MLYYSIYSIFYILWPRGFSVFLLCDSRYECTFLMVFQDIFYLFIFMAYKLILASLGHLKGLSKQIIYWPKNFWNQLFMRISDEFKENEY